MFASNEILKDAIDLHIHVGPDYIARYGDARKLAQEAEAAGMRAIIIKGHLLQSVTAAHEANSQFENVLVFGGSALNEPNGGFNPRSVEAVVRAGGKMIWLPTVDAQYAIDKANEGHWIGHYVNGSVFGYDRQGMSVLDNKGKLKNNVQLILRICKEGDSILGTGHVSPEEALILAKEAKAIGYNKLEITHPNAWLDDFNISVLQELTSLGATLTLSYGVCSMQNGGQHPAEIVHIIKTIGAEHCALITDYGQTIHPSPAEGMRVYASILMHFGVTRAEIDLMIRTNPARLLSI